MKSRYRRNLRKKGKENPTFSPLSSARPVCSREGVVRNADPPTLISANCRTADYATICFGYRRFPMLRGRPPLVSPLKSCMGRSFTAMSSQPRSRSLTIHYSRTFPSVLFKTCQASPMPHIQQDRNSALITQSSGSNSPPATTQIDRMQSKATNRNRFAEHKGFSR